MIFIVSQVLEIACSGVEINRPYLGHLTQTPHFVICRGTSSPHCNGVPIDALASITRTEMPASAA